MFCSHECLHTTCIPAALRGQKRVVDPLELELGTVVRQYVGPGILTRGYYGNKVFLTTELSL